MKELSSSKLLLPTDTAEDVATKVHALEYTHYPRIIEQLLTQEA